MLDMSFVRSNPELVKEGARRKGQPAPVDDLLALDEQRRRRAAQADELRALRNRVSKDIAEKKKSGAEAAEAIAEMRKVSEEIARQEGELRQIEQQVRALALTIPNLPAPDVPLGRGKDDNVTLRESGERRNFSFKPKAHWDLGRELDILDFERAAKIAGAHFALFKGAGAALERALFNFMLDLQTQRGYTEVFTPFLVNRDAIIGTGQLPKFEEDMYRCEVDDLFLIPTAEVPLVNMHRDEILDAADLPIRYAAYSACFRREAGSYGRDTRALMRVHQFDKVELVKFVEPETSWDELESLLDDAEEALKRLGLSYRVRTLCTAELGFASAKTYDIEVWAPGIERYMEVSSCSNCEDFQARRATIRYRARDGSLRFVHTLNGSGVALPRTILAILETYQQEDGTIVVPEALRPYMSGRQVISRNPRRGG